MLLNFTCSNFRSFRDEQLLSMIPGPTKNHQSHLVSADRLEVLSLSAIFGANASGKSNIYKAIRSSRDFILGRPFDPQSYYRLEPEYKDKPTTFEYELSTGGNFYKYGFQVILSTGEITGEWLWRMSANDSEEDTLIFQRPLKNNDHPKPLSKFKLRTFHLLYLTLVDEMRKSRNPGIKEMIDVRDWFENNLVIISTEENLFAEMDYDDEQCEQLARFLNDFDVGITDVGFKFVSPSVLPSTHTNVRRSNVLIQDHYIRKAPDSLPLKERLKISEKVLLNKHGSEKDPFLWFDESDGTRRLMELAPIVLSRDSDRTYIVDELDRSLHPLVVYEFVRKFVSHRAIGPKKQLIFTTHQTSLLDQDLLRRDEIWFVQKENTGATELYSLDDFKERFDKNIEKMYMDGRYNGIPSITKGNYL